jgi:predicted nucleic acid-binding protein
MVYVYDLSFVGTLIVPDEKNSKVEKFHEALGEDEVIFTSQLFWYEISNFFYNLLRRKLYLKNDILPFYSAISNVGLITDFETGIDYSSKIFLLCDKYQLSAYDAAYLELAERKKAVLCTLDKHLKTSAKKHGIEVINAI